MRQRAPDSSKSRRKTADRLPRSLPPLPLPSTEAVFQDHGVSVAGQEIRTDFHDLGTLQNFQAGVD
jgi:hypothetical protein